MGTTALSGLKHSLNFREDEEQFDLRPRSSDRGPLQPIWDADKKAALRLLDQIDELKHDNERLKQQLKQKEKIENVKAHAKHVIEFIDSKFIEATRLNNGKAQELYKLMNDIADIVNS